MTLGALPAQPLFVYIIGLVALHAFLGRLLEGRRYMAFLAGHRRMQTDQREMCQVMIEHHLVTPAALLMTTRAILALLAAMDIIGTMTIDAGLPDLVLEIAAVAGHTGDLRMASAQWKIGLATMVETGL